MKFKILLWIDIIGWQMSFWELIWLLLVKLQYNRLHYVKAWRQLNTTELQSNDPGCWMVDEKLKINEGQCEKN